jgi:hypothetical protein
LYQSKGFYAKDFYEEQKKYQGRMSCCVPAQESAGANSTDTQFQK